MGKKNKNKTEQVNPGSAPVQFLHRDLSTQNQIHMLLAVSQTMMGFLINPSREAENIPGQHSLPGEARIAAETTFIKSCSVLDAILEDKKRWTPEFQEKLEKFWQESITQSISESKARQASFEAQKLAADEVRSPHFRYRPALLMLKDGCYAAVLGDLNKPEESIAGIGDTPAEAVDQFDNVFRGEVSPEVGEWLTEREACMEAGKPHTTPFPKSQTQQTKTNDNDNQTVE